MNHNVNAKFCPDCGDARPLDEFYPARSRRGTAYSVYCKEHTKQRARAYYHANRDHCIAVAADWRRRNAEYRRQWCIDYRRRKGIKPQRAIYHRSKVSRLRGVLERHGLVSR